MGVIQYACNRYSDRNDYSSGLDTQTLINLRDYLSSNSSGLRNYAHGRRKGLRISSALAESAMSHLLNQRMGKRQPICWSAKGAHLLLQVRWAVLDNRLDWMNSFANGTQIFRHQQPAPL